MSKTAPEEPAKNHFDAMEIELLQKATKTDIRIVKEHIVALGKLVNFAPTKKQPFPGEKLLWQAIQLLEAMKKGFLLAKSYGTG